MLIGGLPMGKPYLKFDIAPSPEPTQKQSKFHRKLGTKKHQLVFNLFLRCKGSDFL